MSARDGIVALAYGSHQDRCMSHSHDCEREAEREADVILAEVSGEDYEQARRAHAHELAEKIRAEKYYLCGEPYGLEGVLAAADLIDPECQ